MKVLVTGGAGFIGSAVIRRAIRKSDVEIVNVDKLTYAATPEALEDCAESPRYHFEKADICDFERMQTLFAEHQPDAVMHLAAETHVDRSIDGPDAFINTNILGAYSMLQAARGYYDALEGDKRAGFRFHHVSTDEVFGALSPTDAPFTEESPYQPNSPYSAAKAGSDHLVRAWGETYGLPVIASNCSNNYGPWQFPEKLIPVMAMKARDGEALPVYGKGENVRDWLHVEDHAEALWLILTRGRLGESYNVGGDAERQNIEVVRLICKLMDARFPEAAPHERLINFVTDRPGHDFRYAIDAAKIKRELGWAPAHDFETGMAETLDWYLENETWWRDVVARGKGAGVRLGLKTGAGK